jgi:superfamily I DNA/RNA helicase
VLPAKQTAAQLHRALPGREVISDKDQLAAISSDAQTGIIIAGPGTGKTTVLAKKIAGVIRNGCEPASILALSFTVKAAAELRDRVSGIAEGDAPQVTTFHSLCASILREQYAAAGIPPDFKILNEAERNDLLAKICADDNKVNQQRLEQGGRQLAWQRLGGYIEERKRYLLLPREKTEDINHFLPSSLVSLIPSKIDEADSIAESLYAEYENQLRSLGAVDYDCLIARTVRLLALREEVLQSYQQKFRHIFVDEYQDINFPQYALIRLLVQTERDSPSLWVIGDPNQAIYGFRGSDKAFIDRFRDDYPGAVCFELRRSFRCAESIITAASSLAKTKLWKFLVIFLLKGLSRLLIVIFTIFILS